MRYISWWHLFLLNYSLYVARIVDLPVCIFPGCLVRSLILNPLSLSVKGTYDAVAMAFAKGFAFNISGGQHHANSRWGCGFSPYCDITIAIKHARAMEGIKRSMIIDLDANLGNGHARDFAGDPDNFTIDFFNPEVFPDDKEALKHVDLPVVITDKDTDETYEARMKEVIPKAIDEFKPELIVFNAGTDTLEGDPIGKLNMKPDGIVRRDFIVFREAFTRKIPIIMVLSGGFMPASAHIVADRKSVV